MSAQIEIEGVVKRFEDVAAVDRVSLSIKKGELFFLLGPSGCGKTTLLRTIAGFYQPNEGRILFDDKDLTGVPPYRRNCGFVFQNYALWPHLSVFENVAYGLRVRKMSQGEIKERVHEALKLVQLPDIAERKPTQLSGGQQQRVALARALVIRPQVLLLDEPLSNLDAKLRLEMRDEIRRIHEELKITTVYVTHEQKEALSLAQRVAIMNRGKIEQVGSPRELYHRPASKFVAGFIGETNFVQGDVEGKDWVSLPFGKLEVSEEQKSEQGKITMCVRPEALEVLKEGTTGQNTFPAIVHRATYLGENEQLSLQLEGDVFLKVLCVDPGEDVHQEGEKISLRIPPEKVRIYAK